MEGRARYPEAERLGATLAVAVRHGMPAVQSAIAALRTGTATPAQQRIAFEFIQAISVGR